MQAIVDFIRQPWSWYVAGIFIGLTVPTLLIFGNKKLGISSSLRHICASCIPSKIPFFSYDWKKEVWNLYFVGGIFIGGYLAAHFLSNPNPIIINPDTKTYLETLGITDFSEIIPTQIFSWDNLFSMIGLTFFVIGGFLVGFGTRYAGGCTSGHTIMGLSNLQLPSLIASCCFMLGGFASANLIVPYVLKHFN